MARAARANPRRRLPSRIQFETWRLRAVLRLRRAGFRSEIECGRMEGPLDKWRALRAQIHDDVCRHGFNSKRGAFVQYYGSDELDSDLKSNAAAWKGRWINGARCARKSTTTSAVTDSIRNVAPSCSTTAPTSWIPI